MSTTTLHKITREVIKWTYNFYGRETLCEVTSLKPWKFNSWTLRLDFLAYERHCRTLRRVVWWLLLPEKKTHFYNCLDQTTKDESDQLARTFRDRSNNKRKTKTLKKFYGILKTVLKLSSFLSLLPCILVRFPLVDKLIHIISSSVSKRQIFLTFQRKFQNHLSNLS